MNLIDEQDIPVFQGSQQPGQVAGFVEDGTGSDFQVHPQFLGYNMGQRRLSKARRTVEKNMVERFPAKHGSLDEDLQIVEHLVLTGKLVEGLGPDHLVELVFFIGKFRPRIEFVCHHVKSLSTAQI